MWLLLFPSHPHCDHTSCTIKTTLRSHIYRFPSSQMKWSYMHTDENVCVMDRILVKKLSLTMNLLSTTSARSAGQTLRLPAEWSRIHACAHSCGLEAIPVTNLRNTLPRRSSNVLIWCRNLTGQLLLSCQLGQDLWRQTAPNCRGCLSSGCHQLFIGLSLSTRTLNHLPAGLVVVVLRRHLHTRAHMQHAFNAHVHRTIQTNTPC